MISVGIRIPQLADSDICRDPNSPHNINISPKNQELETQPELLFATLTQNSISFEDVPSDHNLLNLVRSLEDGIDTRITIESLNRQLS